MKEPSPEDIRAQALQDLIAGKARYGAPSGLERNKDQTLFRVDANSMEKLFWEALVESSPNLGVSLNQAVESGKIVKEMLTVRVTPNANKQLLLDLLASPLIHALIEEKPEQRNLKLRLEREGKLDPGTTLKAIVWHLEQQAKMFDEQGRTKEAQETRESIAKIGVRALTDQEIKEIFKKAIRAELEK